MAATEFSVAAIGFTALAATGTDVLDEIKCYMADAIGLPITSVIILESRTQRVLNGRKRQTHVSIVVIQAAFLLFYHLY